MSRLMELVGEYKNRVIGACIGDDRSASDADESERLLSEIRAAVQELEREAAAAQFLYGLLDDIDTASDMAKSNDAAYRKMAEQIQAKRWAIVDLEKFDAHAKHVPFIGIDAAMEADNG